MNLEVVHAIMQRIRDLENQEHTTRNKFLQAAQLGDVGIGGAHPATVDVTGSVDLDLPGRWAIQGDFTLLSTIAASRTELDGALDVDGVQEADIVKCSLYTGSTDYLTVGRLWIVQVVTAPAAVKLQVNHVVGVAATCVGAQTRLTAIHLYGE